MKETEIGGHADRFPSTHWSWIARAREHPEAQRAAFEELLPAYWKPLYFYARRKGLSVDASKDAVQGLYARLLERDFLARLDPARGSLRGYLRTALDNYLANLHAKEQAQKRGGGAEIVELDLEVAERELVSASGTPQAAYEHEWALATMERALERLRSEFEERQRRGPFEIAVRFFQPGDPSSYADAALAAHMSVEQFKAFLHRARERFRTLVREEVAKTVSVASETDGEIAELIRALGA